MYLFKRTSDGVWIFGQSTKSICPAGKYRLNTSADLNTITLHAIHNRDIALRYPETFSSYKKENGQAYASFSEFEAATKDFFDPGKEIVGSVTVAGVATAAKQDAQSTALNQPAYVDSIFTLTRPADTTPYSDGDAIRDTVGIATQKFAGIAKLAGRGVNFINLLAFTNDTGLTGKTINVVFYKESPANPIADNAAFVYAAANELIRKGTVQLTFGTGPLAGVAQIGIDMNTGMLNLELCPTATDVFIQVWLPTGYTPSANSTYIIFKASAIQN